MTNQSEETRKRVLSRVKECFRSLVGGSGHLASYLIDEETFRIDRCLPREDGSVRYWFSAQAHYLSEFSLEDDAPDEPHQVSGSIVLTEDFGVVYGEDGEALLEPYKTLLGKRGEKRGAMPEREDRSPRDGPAETLSGSEIDDLLKHLNQ